MRVLVTGATGALGRRVLPRLAAEGHDVTAVARGKGDQVAAAGAAPFDLDLFDVDAVTAAARGQDAVVDLATRIPPAGRMALPWAWRDNDRLRREAAPLMAAAAARAGARYVRESIGMLYADAGKRWVSEDDPVAPIAHTRTALDAEAAALEVTAAGGVGVVLRFAMFYGVDTLHTTEQLDMARRGIAMVLGDPHAYLSQLHLDDAASAVVAALHARPGLYNVVEDDPLRRHEFVAVLSEVAGRQLRTPPRWLGRVGAARVAARSVRMSNAAFREATGWAPVHASARDGWRQVATLAEAGTRSPS